MPEVELWRVWLVFLGGLKRLAGFAVRVVVVLTLLGLGIGFVPPLIRRMVDSEFAAQHASHPFRPRPKLPPRDHAAPANTIDLSNHYNATLTENWHEGQGGSLAALPSGLQEFKGVLFDVRGIVQLAGRQLARQGYPNKVTGITVNRVCRRIYFLHATGWTEEPGKHIGDYVIHYADGRRGFFPILYGREVVDWYPHSEDPPVVPGVTTAWDGNNSGSKRTGSERRLFLSAWQNPAPDIEIRSIDFVSTMTEAAPFLIAITTDP
jgi:hypothetical protein